MEYDDINKSDMKGEHVYACKKGDESPIYFGLKSKMCLKLV